LCHFDRMMKVVTFSMHAFPVEPDVLALDPAKHERAVYLAGKKRESENFRSLLRQWTGAEPAQ